jgi:hypothetical protein
MQLSELRSVKRHGIILIALACFGCAAVVSGVSDPRAAGPRNDRWEVVIRRPRSAVFDVALRVLADSGYVTAQTNLDVGVISTADRRASPAMSGAQQPGTMLSSDYPVRLTLVMTPFGIDSTRLSIAGQYRRENTKESGSVTARSDEWRYVRTIGEAILARLR